VELDWGDSRESDPQNSNISNRGKEPSADPMEEISVDNVSKIESSELSW
jgi:hypothetical protein